MFSKEIADVLKLRLKEKCKITERGCWEWTGGRNRPGYGQTRVPGVGGIGVHRLSHMLFIGPLEPGLHVMHLCDNPPCFNPEHLKQGALQENMARAKALGHLGGKRRGAGRKPRIKGKASAIVIPVRVTKGERAAWERTANEVALADWIRDTLNHTARHKP